MEFPQALGYLGGVIAGVAYVPQINHLISEKCTAGLSVRAFSMWALASFLVFVSALAAGVMVFVFLSFIQLVASTIIIVFTIKFQGEYCPIHIPVK